MRGRTLTEGPVLSGLLTFCGPVLLALILQALYGAVDLWAVGRFGTTADISAVSTGSQTMQMVIGGITGLSMGVTVLLGRGGPGRWGQPVGVRPAGSGAESGDGAGRRTHRQGDERPGGGAGPDGGLYPHLRRGQPVHRGL